MASIQGRLYVLPNRGDGLLDMAGGQIPQYPALPIYEPGLFKNQDTSAWTNNNALYEPTIVRDLGGTFEFFIGGRFKYTRGFTGQTGTAELSIEVIDYDGQGSNTIFPVTILVS